MWFSFDNTSIRDFNQFTFGMELFKITRSYITHRISISGTGGMETALYVCDFDSMEAYGRFWDQVSTSDWFVQLRKDVADAHPQLRMADQVVMYDAIAD